MWSSKTEPQKMKNVPQNILNILNDLRNSWQHKKQKQEKVPRSYKRILMAGFEPRRILEPQKMKKVPQNI